MNKVQSTVLCITAAAALSLGTFGTAAADEVTLKSASCFPIGSPPSRPYEAVVKTINEPARARWGRYGWRCWPLAAYLISRVAPHVALTTS